MAKTKSELSRLHNCHKSYSQHLEDKINQLHGFMLKDAREIRNLTQALAAARAEIREWEECYAGQLRGENPSDGCI